MNTRATMLMVLLLCAGCASPQLRLYEGSRATAEVAVITLPEQLEVASVNGKEVPGARGMSKTGEKRLEVLPGRYEALVYYRELWQDGDTSEIVRSKNVALFVIDAQAGHRYHIDYEHPAHRADATKLAADFHGWVEDGESGMRQPSQSSGLAFRAGIVAQVTGDDTLVATAPAKPNTQVQPVAPLAAPESVQAKKQPPVPAAAPIPAQAPPPATVSDRDWLATMKAWWQQATPDERRAFLRWVGDTTP
jgi:hypothetical protein